MSKYAMVGCSQCGARFDGGDEGYSLCRNHRTRSALTDRQIADMTAHAAAIKAGNDAYTRGQLRAGLQGEHRRVNLDRLYSDGGSLIALVFGSDGSNDEADAARLAACWNACAGIPTAVLELCGTCIPSTALVANPGDTQ